MNRLIIVGASGHGKVVANIARLRGYTDIVFLDKDPAITSCFGCPVLGSDDLLSRLEGEVFMAIGNYQIRKKLMDYNKNRIFPILTHPASVISKDVIIGNGSVVMANSVINPGTVIGKGCIVNTCSSIDHDCIIGDYVHVSVGSHLCGTVKIDDYTWIGAGAIVSNNVHICSKCIIGAGAVVVKSIDEPGTYVGIPARRIEV